MKEPENARNGLSTAKQALMGRLLSRRGRSPDIAISRRTVTGPTPLSFAQQRLWFLHQLNPDSPTSNIPASFRLTGPLDVNVLARTMAEITQRHEILRTSFVVMDGQPFQVVKSVSVSVLPLVDLESLGKDGGENEAERLVLEEAGRRFALDREPAWRITLVRLSSHEHLLLITLHHLICDGWSLGIFGRELATLYQCYCQGARSPLEPLPLQYADFAVWQRQYLQGEVLEDQITYWREQLNGVEPVLELGINKTRPAAISSRGGHQVLMFDRELRSKLVELSQAAGATMFMVLAAAFTSLLSRYSGQDDISVGTPIAGRSRTELEGLIGFFANTLVLRTKLADDPPFAVLLYRVQQSSLGAYEHQDLPFERLVEELQPERSLSHTPLFQVMFALQNAPTETALMPGLILSPLSADLKVTTFDLTLTMVEIADVLIGSMEYKTELYEEGAIQRLVTHLGNVLRSVVENPAVRVSELSLLSDAERLQVIEQCSNTNLSCVDRICLHVRFEMQVQRRPHAIALITETEQLTYHDLNCRANKLAHHLQCLGVGPEVVVGLCLDRSADLVVAILATLKAGGAYLPLDPTYPTERITATLQDAQARLLITQHNLVKDIAAVDITPIYIDNSSLWSQINDMQAEHNPVTFVVAENLAYVIYTSGSTGQGKGVLISHANVSHLLSATESLVGFNACDVCTLFHSAAFDFSVWELWGALAYGGALVVVTHLVSRSPQQFWQLLNDHSVTVLNQTPSAFGQLLDAAPSQLPASLRLVVLGGEELAFQSLRPWFDLCSERAPLLLNMYGITETTVHVTHRLVGSNDICQNSGSLIGLPITNMQVYVLDRYRQPVPIDVTGELFVGGEGLARGYLGRPDLTADRFAPDPFSLQPGARLYKAGDMGRRLVNGELQYLGRRDQQVKLRGYRIELGEIEATLRQHTGVSQSVVVLREVAAGDKRLVAYVENAARPAPTSRELLRYLKGKLPAYMVPETIIVLDEFPLTSNGKLNRRALPEPNRSRPELSNHFLAPRTPVERMVAGIFADVLKLDQVGVYDNFFDLGGHSLSLTRLASRIREEFQVEVPLRILFDGPTVADMTNAIAGLLVEQEDLAEVAQMLKELRQLSSDELRAFLESEA